MQYDQTTAKYNFLSNIPYLGEKFFTPKSSKYTPTELLIFIKPTIIDPNADSTIENSKLIDDRLNPDFVPRFQSPSGKKLDPIGEDKPKANNIQDLQSSKPSLF